MSERFTDFRTKDKSESHTRKCSNRRCPNKINNKQLRLGVSECQSCLERKDSQMVTALTDIRNFKIEIAAKKITLARLQGNIDTHTKGIEKSSISKFNLEDLQNQAVILAGQIDFLEQSLLRSQILVKYKQDLVSNDHKYYDGIATNGKEWTLETHCTIVRVQDSPEDVFFGHVTLIISKNEDTTIFYKWHYGIETFPFKFPHLPKDSNNEFWYYDNKKLDPDSTQVSRFATFHGIPDNTLISDIMKYQLDNCVRSFRKRTQWENQVWKPNDKIDGEDATSLIERLNKIQTDSATYDTATHQATLEQLRKDLEEKEKERQKRIDERQKAEDAAIKAEAAAKKTEAAKKALYVPTELSEVEKTFIAGQISKMRTEWEKAFCQRRAAEKKDNQEKNAREIAQLLAKQQKDREAEKDAAEKTAKAKALDEAKKYERQQKSKALQQTAQEIQKKIEEDKKALETAHKQRIRDAKIYVDQKLQAIRKDIEKITIMKNDIENKEKDELYLWSEQSFKDRNNLMKECNTLISYIETNMKTFEKEIDLLQDEPEPLKIEEIYKYKFTVLDFKNNVYRSNLEDIEKWKFIYETTFLPKETLLKNDDYRRNPDNLDDVKKLFYFYDEFIDIAEKWISSLQKNTGLLTKEDYNNMFKYISDINKTIQPYKRYISTQFFMNLLIVKRYYITSISPIEEQLKDIRYRRNIQSLTDISELIDFYRDYYEQTFVQVALKKIKYDELEKEYVSMIKKDIKNINDIVNHKESLARSQISKKILEYNFEIKDKGEKLLTLYREEKEAILIMKRLIPFYREYLDQLKEWNLSLSNLQEKDGCYMNDDILYLKSLIQNPEQFLESLCMMHGHNLIELCTFFPDDKDEPEEHILYNIEVITLTLGEKDRKAGLLISLIKNMIGQGPYSTKKAISQFKLGTNKLEERIKLLKEDAFKLIRVLEQETLQIRLDLEDDPMTEEAKYLRKELRKIFNKYRYFTMNLISHIKEKIKDEDSILELLDYFLKEIDKAILYLDYGDANKSLHEMEEYYNQYIQPRITKLRSALNLSIDLSIDQLNSLRAYYQTFEFDMTALVKNKIQKLNPTDTLTENINLRIQTLTNKVKPNAHLIILKELAPPDSAPSVTKDQTQLFDRNSLIEYYNDFPDENEEDETIIRNFMIFQPQIQSYPIVKDIVIQIKNFRGYMYGEKTFSTKSVLQYYGSCL